MTDYLYDLAGHAITELNGSGGWMRGEIYAGGGHIATYVNGTTYFNHADWLGTERARTAMNGTLCETITSLPFGDGMNTSGGCGDPSTHHFTGKMRDMETNLDYFGARYNSSSLGRFMSADWAAKPTSVPYAQFGDPQSLNLYSYAGNNPLSHDDVDGHCWPLCGIVTWVSTGVAVEGGRNFAKDVGIGIAKGAGSFAVNTGKTLLGAGQMMAGNLAGLKTLTSPGPAALKPSNEVQAQTSAVTQVAIGVGTALATAGAGSEAGLADDALVVRGGIPTAAQLTKGAETISPDGTLSGVSVNSANGATVEQLSSGIPNNQIGVTTVGDVRAAGGDVVPTPSATNPCHCDLNGVTAERGNKLFNVQPNPSKVKVPQ